MHTGKGKDRASISDVGQLSVPAAVIGVKIPTVPRERIWPRFHYEHQALVGYRWTKICGKGKE